VGVAGVQFLLDGANLGAEDTTAPYTLRWTTTTASNGVHTITARARDAAGNQTTSAAVSATVSNDTTAPTISVSTPAAGSTVSGTISLSATAADNVGVAGVQFLVDGANLGTEVTVAPYTQSWNTGTAGNGPHSITARARDAAGNQTTSVAVGVTVSNSGPSNLVAAYGFNEGAGTTSADLSGNGHAATLVNGPVWSSGKYANGLTFDGVNDAVTLANPSTINLGTSNFTVMLWTKRNALGGAQRHLFSKCSATGWQTGCKELYFSGDTLKFGSAGTGDTNSINIADTNWHHIALVFTRVTNGVQIYVDGTLRTTATKNLEADNAAHVFMLGNLTNSNPYSGLIDEVRIYQQALTAAEVSTDMTTPVTAPGPDTSPPTTPTGLAALALNGNQISLSWGASADNVGVTGYGVERCQGVGCADFAQNASSTGTSLTDSGLSASTSYSYRVRATDSAGNFSFYSNTATAATQAPDVVAPTTPTALTAVAIGTNQINLSWSASSDDIGVTGYLLERCEGAGCGTFTQVLTPTGTSVSNVGLAAGTSYSYRVRATDAAGNLGGYSITANATTALTNPVIDENLQAGSSAWQLGDLYGRPYATDSVGQIKGYASSVSVNKGESINFHVSVNPVQSFTVDVYRIGWYQGLGARLMQQVGPLNGVQQPACPLNASTGLMECGWTASYTLNTQTSWTSGIYLAVLKNAQGFYNYMIFTLRDDSRAGALLYQQPVTTAQAYNTYPRGTGKSLYDSSNGANTIAGTPRAVKVSFDRPYEGRGDGQFLELSEINFVRWAEKSGYDITYSTDVDTHRDGARLLNHRGFLSLPHDEYWSKPMYDAAVTARDSGVHLAFFGANTIFWQIRFEQSSGGVADRVIVCYKDLALDPVTDLNVKTVKWRDEPNRPEQALLGVQFTDGPKSGTANYVVTNSGNWVYAGTGFVDGAIVPGIVWYESDRQVAGTPLPPALTGTYTLLSHSPYTGSGNTQDFNSASIYQAQSGAWVFASGTMGWGFALDGYYPEGSVNTVDVRIQRATTNVLNRFLGR
jgi:chitodextrinase